MKHLTQSALYGSKVRRFNESNIDALNGLKDLCEGSLAFLLDDLIKINYIYKGQVTYGTGLTNKDGSQCTITHDVYMIEIASIIVEKNGGWDSIVIPEASYDSQVKWDDIKDYFIPFLGRLSSEVYKIQGWFGSNDIIMIRSIEKKTRNFEFKKFSKVTNTYDYYDIEKDRVREDKFWSLSIKVEI